MVGKPDVEKTKKSWNENETYKEKVGFIEPKALQSNPSMKRERYFRRSSKSESVLVAISP